MHEGNIGSMSRPGHAVRVDRELVEGHEAVVDRRRSLCAIPTGDRHPGDRRTHGRHDLGVIGLGDRRHALGLLGEPRHLFGDGLGVGRHPDRPDRRAGEPGQDQFRGVVGVQQDLVAHLHPPRVEPRGEPADVVPQLAVGPGARGPVRRVPDDRRVLRPVLGPQGQQPRDVLALHLVAPELGLGRVDCQSRFSHAGILSVAHRVFQSSVPGRVPSKAGRRRRGRSARLAQVALEHLARGVARQRLQEGDVLRRP